MLTSFGDLVCNGILSGALGIGALLTLLIRSDLKRQEANRKTVSSDDALDVPTTVEIN